MNALQDVSFEHADAVGLDHSRVKKDSMALLLSGWRVRMNKPLLPGTAVTRTGIMNLGTCDAVRCYEICQNGESIVSATAIWFTVDTSVRKVTRVPEDYGKLFESVNEADNGLPYDRIMPEKTAEFIENFTVEPRDIDANNHLNNVKYIEKMLNLLPGDTEISEFQIKYRKEVKCGQTVSVYGKETEKGFYFDIRNESGAICTFAYVNKK